MKKRRIPGGRGYSGPDAIFGLIRALHVRKLVYLVPPQESEIGGQIPRRDRDLFARKLQYLFPAKQGSPVRCKLAIFGPIRGRPWDVKGNKLATGPEVIFRTMEGQ